MVTEQAPRRRRTPRWLVAVAAALALVGGPLPAVPAAAQADSEPKTLTMAADQPVDSLSPFIAQRLISTNIHRYIYDYLTNYDPKTNEPIPALAESWETSEDDLTWTYKIRDDVKWSDDEPLTSEDIAWTYTTMMEDEAAATANGNFVANFEKVTAPDPTTLEIKLKKPQATMLALDIPIVPKHVWEKVDDFGKFNNDEEFPIVGSGPFELTKNDENQGITLEANKDYWRGAPKFDRVVFKYFSDQDAMVEGLKSGEVSLVAPLTPAQANSLKDAEDIKVNTATGKRFNGFTVNPGARTQDGEKIGDGNPALKDKTLRQAMMKAIDKDAVVEKVYGGYAEPGEGYIPKRYKDYYWEPEGADRLDFDPDAANKMLDDAGYKMGDDGIRETPDGDPLKLRMAVHNDKPDYVDTGKFMEEWLKDIGIEIEGQYVDSNLISEKLNGGEYDLIFTGWNVNPDPDYVLGLHTCDALPEEKGSMRGDAFYCNKEYDKLYDQQIEEYDPEKRADIIKEMQQILYEDAVVNVIDYPGALEGYRTDQVASFQVQPEPGGNIWGQDGYWAFYEAVPAKVESGSGMSTGLLVGIGAAVVIVLGAGAFLVLRRRSATADDRE